MADGYWVDTVELQEVGHKLAALRDEFLGIEDTTDRYEGVVGSGEVAEALHEFSSNWSHKRTDIATNLRGVADIATKAATGYWEADLEIAQAFKEH